MPVPHAKTLRGRGLQPRHAPWPFDSVPPILVPQMTGLWFCNRAPGESDGDARMRFTYNRAPGARNRPQDRQLQAAHLPEVLDDEFIFHPQGFLKTRVTETTGQSYYFFGGCLDASLGVGGTGRGFVMGNNGNSLVHGSGIQFSTDELLQVVGFRNTASPISVTHSLSVPTDSCNKRRLYGARISASQMSAVNLTGDSVNNDPTGTPMTGGHVLGQQAITLGGRNHGSSSTVFVVPIRASLFMTVSGVYSGPQEATMAAWLNGQIDLGSLMPLDAIT